MARRQATGPGSVFPGVQRFATATDAAALQAICDWLGPATIRCLRRWMSWLPLPLTEATRRGPLGKLSMRQIEVAHPGVRRAAPRPCFEALAADNLDIGRPDSVKLIFHGPDSWAGHPNSTASPDEDRHRGTKATVNAFFKSRINST